MKFDIISSNKIAGAKLELGPLTLEQIRIALVNTHQTLAPETLELRSILNGLHAEGRLWI